MATRRSRKTCTECGRKGEVVDGLRICPECYAEALRDSILVVDVGPKSTRKVRLKIRSKGGKKQ